MNHKRGKPKSTLAGYLPCKPHKHQPEKHRNRARAKREAKWPYKQWSKLIASDCVVGWARSAFSPSPSPSFPEPEPI